MKRYQSWVFSLAVLMFAACAGGRQNARLEKDFQEHRKDFIAACENKLEELGRGIDQAIEASEYSNNHKPTELNAQIVELVREKSAVGRKLEFLRAADHEIWPYMKTDLEAALDDLAELFAELQASLSSAPLTGFPGIE